MRSVGGFVRTGDDGRALTSRRISEASRVLARRVELPSVRLDDRRHFHATMLAEAGEDPRAVWARLGHSRVSVTLDVCTDLFPDMEEGAARATEDARGKLIRGL